MNDWQRVGVVATICRAVIVCGYAGYEYFQLGEGQFDGEPPETLPKGLSFVEFGWGYVNLQGSIDALNRSAAAKSESERQQALAEFHRLEARVPT